jgi:hypothetical protein
MNVFVSHSQQDRAMAERIEKKLSSKGVLSFFDQNKISIGDSLLKAITTAVENAQVFIPIISRNSSPNGWMNQEMSLALSKLYKHEPVRIIPVIIDRQAHIPLLISDLKYVDLSDPSTVENNLEKLADAVLAIRDKIPTNESLKDRRVEEEYIKAQNEVITLEKRYLELRANEREKNLRLSIILGLFSSIAASLTIAVFFSRATELKTNTTLWLIAVVIGILILSFSVFRNFLYKKQTAVLKIEIERMSNDRKVLLQGIQEALNKDVKKEGINATSK